MTRNAVLLATIGSAGLLLGALAFQYWGGLAPCKMCIWQRWPHGIAIVIGFMALATQHRALPLLGALVVITGAGIAFYHTGVEFGVFEGPDTCTSGPITGLTADELLDQINNAPLVRCDVVPWSFLGLSMAAWNGVISVVLALIWVVAARANRQD